MNAEQSMKQYIGNFLSNYLPDDEIEDNGVPQYKVSALKEYVVDQLMERLEDMLKNEIDYMKKDEDPSLFEMFEEDDEEFEKTDE